MKWQERKPMPRSVRYWHALVFVPNIADPTSILNSNINTGERIASLSSTEPAHWVTKQTALCCLNASMSLCLLSATLYIRRIVSVKAKGKRSIVHTPEELESFSERSILTSFSFSCYEWSMWSGLFSVIHSELFGTLASVWLKVHDSMTCFTAKGMN